MFAIDEKIICCDAKDVESYLTENEVYTVIGFNIENGIKTHVLLKGLVYKCITNQNKSVAIPFKLERFKKLSYMENTTKQEKPIWFEVYKADEEEGTETIESFDTEQEAIDFIGDDETLDYDKWTLGADGTNQRIE